MFCYIPMTVPIVQDNITLAEFDCEAKITYKLPDGPRGPIDWYISGFHFDGPGLEPGQKVFTEVTLGTPLYKILLSNVDDEWLGEQLRETLANDGLVPLYPAAPHA